jgi:hypothetical protein
MSKRGWSGAVVFDDHSPITGAVVFDDRLHLDFVLTNRFIQVAPISHLHHSPS